MLGGAAGAGPAGAGPGGTILGRIPEWRSVSNCSSSCPRADGTGISLVTMISDDSPITGQSGMEISDMSYCDLAVLYEL